MIYNLVKNIKLLELKNNSVIYVLIFDDNSYVYMCNLTKLYYNTLYRDGNLKNSETKMERQMHDDIKCRRINKLYNYIISQSYKFNKDLPDFIIKIINRQCPELKFSDDSVNSVLNFVLTDNLVEYYACESHARNDIKSYGVLERVKYFYGIDHFYISMYKGYLPSNVTGSYYKGSIIQFFNRV